MVLNDTLKGLIACGISTCLFGSILVPIKQFDPGDGFFLQWVMDAGIFLFGMIINAYEGFPKFYPLAMLGGAIWAIGNASSTTILRSIGMGMGALIWCTTCCLIGWASSRFGLFGLKENVPNSVILNYAGLLFILFGGALFTLVESTPQINCLNKIQETRNSSTIDLELSALPLKSRRTGCEELKLFHSDDRKNGNSKKSEFCNGIILSLFAGVSFGLTFVPVIYIQEHPNQFENATSEALPYVFAHYTGIFITGTIILVIYTIIKLNKPMVNHQIILPAFTSGIMWAIAQTSWFVANNYIPQSISFPINSMVPGVIAVLWSVIYFRKLVVFEI
ncbi:hypothetical protein DINM_001744 [Dirofilaria immitis]|nr:hypothetical protein [Dirofilaria immitis]